MGTYIIRRVIGAVLTLVVVSIDHVLDLLCRPAAVRRDARELRLPLRRPHRKRGTSAPRG